MVHFAIEDIQVSVLDLEVGMHVVKLDRPWSETPFLLQGFVIRSQREIDELRQYCQQVTIQVRIEQIGDLKAKLRHSALSAKPVAPKASVPGIRTTGPTAGRRVKYLNKVSFEEAVEASRLTFDSARAMATSVLDGLRVGRALDIEECREVVDEVVSSVLANEDALRFLTMIKNKDLYTAEHSMNVCVLTAAFARHLGLKEFEIRQVALCGLLHDVGKSRIPLEILNKPGRFTKEEAYIMAEHTTHGRNILMSASAENSIAVDVAHSHHERLDGKGYPRGLRENQISYYSRIVTIVDAYDAMTSERVYGKPKSSQQALHEILKSRGTQVDYQLATEFVKSIGVFRAGALVTMDNGQLAIVIRANRTDPTKPRLLLVTSALQQPLKQERVIDLAAENAPDLAIGAEVPNGTSGIDVSRFIARGLKLDSR